MDVLDSIATTTAVTTAGTGESVLSKTLVHAKDVSASVTLTLLILAVYAAVFLTPPMSCAGDFYREILRKKKISWWRKPPRFQTLLLWLFAAGVCLVIAGVFYLNENNSPSTSEATNYYVAIESLFITLFMVRFLWQALLWNFNSATLGMVMAILFSICLPIWSLVLFILLAIRGSYVAMAFCIIAWLLYMPFPVWTATIYYHYSTRAIEDNKEAERDKKDKKEKKKHHSERANY